MTGRHTDIFVLDERGRRVVDVEVRARESGSDEWVAEVHEMLVELGVFQSQMQILVTRDRTYIWFVDGAGHGGMRSIETSRLLGEMLAGIGLNLDTISGDALELAAGEWLGRLAASLPSGDGLPEDPHGPWKTLVDSVRWGTVKYGDLSA